VKRRFVYPVKEAFLTLQGEGAHAGARAVFVRFAGCNVWSGREEHRERDTAKGCCAAWCDTDFVGTNGENGGAYTAREVADLVVRLWGDSEGPSLVVCTGGEPSLSMDDALVAELHRAGALIHVETNGSNPLPAGVDWVTLSPKPPMPVVLARANEIKCVYPSVDPLAYDDIVAQFRFVQPRDAKSDDQNAENMKECVAFVMREPRWRLSLQTHKMIGLP